MKFIVPDTPREYRAMVRVALQLFGWYVKNPKKPCPIKHIYEILPKGISADVILSKLRIKGEIHLKYDDIVLEIEKLKEKPVNEIHEILDIASDLKHDLSISGSNKAIDILKRLKSFVQSEWWEGHAGEKCHEIDEKGKVRVFDPPEIQYKQFLQFLESEKIANKSKIQTLYVEKVEKSMDIFSCIVKAYVERAYEVLGYWEYSKQGGKKIVFDVNWDDFLIGCESEETTTRVGEFVIDNQLHIIQYNGVPESYWKGIKKDGTLKLSYRKLVRMLKHDAQSHKDEFNNIKKALRSNLKISDRRIKDLFQRVKGRSDYFEYTGGKN